MQHPDYNYLRGLFRGCLKRHAWEEDYEFDWCKKKSKTDLYSAANSPKAENKVHKKSRMTPKKHHARLDRKESADMDGKSRELDVEEQPQPRRTNAKTLGVDESSSVVRLLNV